MIWGFVFLEWHSVILISHFFGETDESVFFFTTVESVLFITTYLVYWKYPLWLSIYVILIRLQEIICVEISVCHLNTPMISNSFCASSYAGNFHDPCVANLANGTKNPQQSWLYRCSSNTMCIFLCLVHCNRLWISKFYQ